MGLSRTVSEINGHFSRKWHFYPPSSILATPLRGSNWKRVTPEGLYKLQWRCNQAENRDWWYFNRLDTIHERVVQTDRQTDTGRQLVPRLRIASRGNNA